MNYLLHVSCYLIIVMMSSCIAGCDREEKLRVHSISEARIEGLVRTVTFFEKVSDSELVGVVVETQKSGKPLKSIVKVTISGSDKNGTASNVTINEQIYDISSYQYIEYKDGVMTAPPNSIKIEKGIIGLLSKLNKKDENSVDDVLKDIVRK